MPTSVRIDSGSNFVELGLSTAGLGDVDGDGYDDVLVSAYIHSNGEEEEGEVYLYRGSAAGLASEPSWSAQGDQVSAQFGFAVAAAGDLNNDGYGDVLITANFFDVNFVNEGRVMLYLGGAQGLSPTPETTSPASKSATPSHSTGVRRSIPMEIRSRSRGSSRAAP